MLSIVPIPVTPYDQNCRMLIDECTKEAVVVDPGGDVPKILEALPDGIRVSAIWITHSHIDHVSGVAELLKQVSTPIHVVAHPEDKINRQNLAMQSELLQFPYSGDFEVTHDCMHGDILTVGGHEFKVLHTPGHAIGHVSFFSSGCDNTFDAPVLIAGDALFKGSIGRTDLPGGNHQQLLDSIRHHLFDLPAQTVVCSGHGPNTSIGVEKTSNPFF